MSKKDNNTKK